MSKIDIEAVINNRIKAIKTAHASNRIEGVVDEEEHIAMLERAKEPISDEEFTYREMSRIYARYGVAWNKRKTSY